MKFLGKLKTYTSKEIDNSYVSIGFECMERGVINPDKCYDLLGKSGIKYARCQTGWAKCETEKGIYDFEWLDKIVDNLLNRGVIPWFCVSYGNPVYMKNLPNPTGVGCVPIYFGQEAIDAWCNYVKVIAERYKGKVEHYEIWNEPNVTNFWYPEKPNGTSYGDFVKLTGSIIRKVNSNAKIGAVVSYPYEFEFIDKMFDCFKPCDIDFFCYHAYTVAPEFRFSAVIKEFRRKLDSRGLNNVEIWQGEGGYPSWAYKGHWLVREGCEGETPQAVYQLRRYLLDIYYGAKRSSFFQIADMRERQYEMSTIVNKMPAAQGILNGLTYTPKESYYTISNLSAIFNGDLKPADYYVTVEPHSSCFSEFISGVAMAFEKNGSPMYAYYLPGELKRSTDYEFDAELVFNKAIEEPVLVDLYSGDVFEIDSDYEYNKHICVCKNLPIKNYPILITERALIEIISK